MAQESEERKLIPVYSGYGSQAGLCAGTIRTQEVEATNAHWCAKGMRLDWSVVTKSDVSEVLRKLVSQAASHLINVQGKEERKEMP